MSDLEQSGFIKHVINCWSYSNMANTGYVFLGILIATSPAETYYDDVVFLCEILDIKGK